MEGYYRSFTLEVPWHRSGFLSARTGASQELGLGNCYFTELSSALPSVWQYLLQQLYQFSTSSTYHLPSLATKLSNVSYLLVGNTAPRENYLPKL